MEFFKKTSYISAWIFLSSKNLKKKPTLKKFLIFQEMELYSHKLKKLLIFFLKEKILLFQEGTYKV